MNKNNLTIVIEEGKLVYYEKRGIMTFGYELEFLGLSVDQIKKDGEIPVYKKEVVTPYKQFVVKNEPDFNDGGELISPVYTDKTLCLKEMEEKLTYLKQMGAYIPWNSEKVGFHIHVGKQFLQKKLERYEILLKFLYAFQAEVYDFACGEFPNLRACFHDYAEKLEEDDILDFLNDFENSAYLRGKGNCLRLKLLTVEFRYFNSSLKKAILQKYLEFVLGLCSYIELEQYDRELIEYYFQHSYDIGLNPKQSRFEVMKRELKIDI